jgi:hypothetical protein
MRPAACYDAAMVENPDRTLPTHIAGLDATLPLSEIGVIIPLSEIYAR